MRKCIMLAIQISYYNRTTRLSITTWCYIDEKVHFVGCSRSFVRLLQWESGTYSPASGYHYHYPTPQRKNSSDLGESGGSPWERLGGKDAPFATPWLCHCLEALREVKTVGRHRIAKRPSIVHCIVAAAFRTVYNVITITILLL